MPTERLAPDALLEQTNLSGAVTDIDEDPDSPDGAWLTAPGSNNATVARVSFPTPTGPLSTGAGLQNFRVLVRKTNHSTDPSCTVELYENGSLVSTLVSGQAVSSTTGTVLAGTWDATGRTAANIECRVSGSTGGGSPGNRASLEVGAIEWNVDYQANSYTLTAAQASFALTGQNANWIYNHVLAASQGAISHTGQAAGTLHGRTLSAAQETYALTGQSAGTLYGRNLTAAQASLSLAGQAATLTYATGATVLTAEQASATLTGVAASMLRGLVLSATYGGISLSGQAAGFLRGIRLPANQAGLSLTGQTATLKRGWPLTASQGTLTLTGQGAAFSRGRILAAGQASFILSAQNAGLTQTTLQRLTLDAKRGSFKIKKGHSVGIGWFRVTPVPCGWVPPPANTKNWTIESKQEHTWTPLSVGSKDWVVG